MQELPLTNYTWKQWAFWLVAGILGSGVTTAVVTRWLYRRKLSAETHQTDATTIETQVRTTVTAGDAIGRYIDWLQEAQERYDALRRAHGELQDTCAELMNKCKQVETDLAQANTTIKLNEHYIAQLHAATKLGMELRDLPPSIDDVILMLQVLRDTKIERLN